MKVNKKFSSAHSNLNWILSFTYSFSQSCLISCWTRSKSAMVHSTWLSWPHYRAPRCLFQSTTSRACNGYTLKSPSRDDLVSDIALEHVNWDVLRCCSIHKSQKTRTTQYCISPKAELCQEAKYFLDLGLFMHI